MKFFQPSAPEFIRFSQIIHITKKVSEPIKSKYLNSFLSTIIHKEEIKITKTTRVYLAFVENTNTYEIYIFKSQNNNNIFEMQVFENYYELNNIKPSKYDVFIYQDFFIVFFDGKFLFYRENKNYQSSDIQKFIKFAYDIEVDNIFQVNNEDFSNFQIEHSNIKPLKTIAINTNYEIYFFGVYFIIVILFGVYFYQQKNETHNKNLLENERKIIDSKTNYNKIVPVLLDFSKNIVNSGVKIQTLRYETKIYALLSGSNDEIYKFLDCYKGKVKIVRFEKNPINSIVEVEVSDAAED